MNNEDMALYKRMYLHLFNSVSLALGEMRHGDAVAAFHRLEKAQKKCEQLFIDGEDSVATS